jgi:hypothetical protein
MSLIMPDGPSWTYCTDNLPASPDYLNFGTAVTSGTSNADGSDTAILSALTHDVEYLRLILTGTFNATANNNCLMDLLVDPAGGTSWSTLIPSLMVGGVNLMSQSGSSVAGPGGIYDFPLWIPAGATLGARIRSAGTSTAPVLNVGIIAKGGNRNPASWWCGQRVTAIGTDPSNSQGTTHSGASSSSSFSSWADFGSTLTADCNAIQFGIGGVHSSSSWSSKTYTYEFGANGFAIGGPMYRTLNSSRCGVWIPQGPIFKRLAAGTQLQARGKCGVTVQALSIAAWAVH